MRYLGPLEWFLDIHITRNCTTRKLWLCQTFYIDKIIARYNISIKSKHPRTSLSSKELVKSANQAIPQEIYAYQQKVGLINFSAMITQPDIVYAASKLSQFLINSSKHHMECVNKTILYLGHTKDYAIEFDREIIDPHRIFVASSNASFGNNLDTRQSF